jgi:Domain of unknown function (DUF4157)
MNDERGKPPDSEHVWGPRLVKVTDAPVAGGDEKKGADRARQPAPGKVKLTGRLLAGRSAAVQRKVGPRGTAAAMRPARSAWDLTMDPWMDAAHRGVTALAERDEVQARGSQGDDEAGDPASVHRVAASGVSGAGSARPHLDRIQEASGPAHDVTGVRAHVGGEAGEASERMGASGEQVAFRDAPDLHTVAHEAAHVIQQRPGAPDDRDASPGNGQARDGHAEATRDEEAPGVVAAHAGAPEQGSP